VRYPLGRIELPANYRDEDFRGKPNLLAREASLYSQLTDQDVRNILRHYYAYCEQVDHAVGIVLDSLTQSGAAADTLTLFTSDHGDSVGAHRTFIKGWTPYEETHRIPMVARWPEVIPAGASIDALPHDDGRDLTPLLREPAGRGPTWRSHILNCFYGSELLYTQRIAISQRYKYVFNGFDWDELYDLERDPGELHNLIDDRGQADVAQDMRDAMWEMMLRHHDPYTQLAYGAARYLAGPRTGLPPRIWPKDYLSDPDHPFLGRQSAPPLGPELKAQRPPSA